jgi:hypothetical protein
MLPNSRGPHADRDGAEQSLFSNLDPDTHRLIRRHEAAMRLDDTFKRMLNMSHIELGDGLHNENSLQTIYINELGYCLGQALRMEYGLADFALAFCLASDCQTLPDAFESALLEGNDITYPGDGEGGEDPLLVMRFDRRCPHKLKRRNRSWSLRLSAPSSCSLCALSLEVEGDHVAGYRHLIDGPRGGEIDILEYRLGLTLTEKMRWFDRERDAL